MITLYLSGGLYICITKFVLDCQNKVFGRKTTLLEAIGLMLPLFHNAKYIVGKHVVLYVDNLPTVWAMRKGRSKTDDYTSTIIAAINHVAVSIPCKLYVKHCPRLSTSPALVADLLTRTDQKGLNIANKYCKDMKTGWPQALIKWMENPTRDLDLGHKIWKDFEHKLLEGRRFCFSFFGD